MSASDVDAFAGPLAAGERRHGRRFQRPEILAQHQCTVGVDMYLRVDIPSLPGAILYSNPTKVDVETRLL